MDILVDLWNGMLMVYPMLMTVWEKVSFVFTVSLNDVLNVSNNGFGLIGMISNILQLLPESLLSLNLFSIMFFGGFITFVVLTIVKWFIGIVT